MADTGTGAGASDDTKKKLPDYLDSTTTTTTRPEDIHEFGTDDDDESDAQLDFADEAGELMELMGTVKAGNKPATVADATPAAETPAGPAAETQAPAEDAEVPEVFEAAPEAGEPPAAGDRPIHPKVKEYDGKFDVALERLNKAITAAQADVTKGSDALKTHQGGSIELFDGIGKERAVATTHIPSQKELDLETRARGLESTERKAYDGLPVRARDLQVLKGCFLISSGKDENIKAGEKVLAELVRDNPALGVDEKFHETVLRAFTEMSTMRKLRGEGDWVSTLKVDDILPAKKPSDATIATGPSATDLLKSASETFFKDGIDKAVPKFDRAKERAELDLNQADRKRLGLFIESLGQDAKIAGASVAGKDISKLAEARAELIGKELAAQKEAKQVEQLSTAIGVNRSFAKIASHSDARFQEGKKELTALVEKNPAMRFNEEFKNSAKNAFKAHYVPEGKTPWKVEAPTNPGKEASGKPVEAPKPTATATNDAGKKPVDITVPDAKDPRYQDLLLTEDSFVKAKDEKEVQSYGVDTLTTVGLYGLGVGLGVASFLRARNSIRAAREAAVQSEIAHKVSPLNGLTEQPKHWHHGRGFEVLGVASTGDVILKQTSGYTSDRGAFQEIKPPKDFNPKKAKFGDFTPMTIGDKNYYAKRSGEVFVFEDGKLKETADTRKLLLRPETAYGRDEAKAAFDATPKEALADLTRTITPDNHLGAHFERVGTVALTENGHLEHTLKNADWKLYNPVDAQGEPLVKPPNRVFRAELDGGRIGSVSLDSLKPGQTFSLVDRNGAGDWTLVADGSHIKGEKTNFATIVVGPKDAGQPDGYQVVMSMQPGDPVTTQPMTDAVLLEKQQGLVAEGKGLEQLKGDLAKVEPGVERRISGITVEQAKALGFESAKVMNPPFPKLSPALQAQSARDLATIFENKKIAPAPGKVTNSEIAKALRDSATLIQNYRAGTANIESIFEAELKIARASRETFNAGYHDEAVGLREVERSLAMMQRDAYIEQFQDKPRELLSHILHRDVELGLKFAEIEQAIADRPGPKTELDAGAGERAERHRAQANAARWAVRELDAGIADGSIKHGPDGYERVIEVLEFEARSTEETHPKISRELTRMAHDIQAFGSKGRAHVENGSIAYNSEGQIAEFWQNGVKYEPGRLEIRDGVMEGKGDIKHWIEREPARIFEIAAKLSSGEIKEFDVKLGAEVARAAESLKTLTPQQIHDGLKAVLTAEKAAVLAGKPANGLRFLFAAGVTSEPKGGFERKAGQPFELQRGVSNFRPEYFSTAETATAADQRWKGLETGTANHAETDRTWLTHAASKWTDGVMLHDGVLVGVGDAKAWLKENPLRALEVIKLASQGADQIGLDLAMGIRDVAPELKNVDRGALFNALDEIFQPGSEERANRAKLLLETGEILKQFPDGDFSTPQKAREWLNTERVRQALDATPKDYMSRMLSTRTPDGRMGSYFETVNGKIATTAAVAEAIKGLEVKPYNPMDANGNPIIKPPARAFQAELPGGRMGMVSLDSLPQGAKLSLVDPKGTGNWSLAVTDATAVGDKTNKVTFIVGPDTDASGKPTGKEIMWTFHPGDAVSPSPVNDAVLLAKNADLASQGKGIGGVSSEADIPAKGSARRIDGISVEQAKALGFGLAKVETPKFAAVDQYTQSTILSQHAERLGADRAGGAKPTAAETRAAELLKSTAQALHDFSRTGTKGDTIGKLNSELKLVSDTLLQQGNASDAILINEVRESLVPLAAREQVNQLVADLRSKTRNLDLPKAVRESYESTARFVEETANRGGFPENRWGYDTMRKIADAAAQTGRNSGLNVDSYDMASTQLRKIAESLPAATGTRDEGVVPELRERLAGTERAPNGYTGGPAADMLKEVNASGHRMALDTVAAAERNPQNPRNAASYAMIGELLATEAMARDAGADRNGTQRPSTIDVSKADGQRKVAELVSVLSFGMTVSDATKAQDIVLTAIDASNGPIDSSRVQEVARNVASLRDVNPGALHEAMTQVLMSDNPGKAVDFLRSIGALKEILPEVAALDGLQQDVRNHPEGNAFDHMKMVLDQAAKVEGLTPPQKRALMWAALLHDVGMTHTQAITPVEGEPNKVTFFKHDQVGADITNKILDRMQVPAAERELVREVVRQHMNMHLGLKDSNTKALITTFGENYAVFAALQQADATGRGVHTPEQYERLKLADAGLPNPVGPDGKPISAEEYWKGDVRTAEIKAQQEKITEQIRREEVQTEFREIVKRYGIEEGKPLGEVMKANKDLIAKLQSADEVREWFKNEANRESLGIKVLKASSLIPPNASMREWLTEQPTRLFEVAAKVSGKGFNGYDYELFRAVGETNKIARVMTVQEVATGIEKVLSSENPKLGLNLLRDARILTSDPPQFADAEARKAWVENAARECIARERANAGGLELARAIRTTQYKDLASISYETDREKVMSLLERAGKETAEGDRLNKVDRDAFEKVREAYGRGDAWAIEMVHDGLGAVEAREAKAAVPADLVAEVGRDVYVKDFWHVRKQAAYAAFIAGGDDYYKGIRESAVLGAEYARDHGLKPEWKFPGAQAMNDDARQLERFIMNHDGGHSGFSFAETVRFIDTINEGGIDAFVAEVEKKSETTWPAEKPYEAVVDKPVAEAQVEKPAVEKPATTGDAPVKALADRTAEFPGIKAGLDVLLQQGKADLVAQIMELKGLDKLPSRAEAYLTQSGANRLSDSARVELVASIIAETRATLGLPATAAGGTPQAAVGEGTVRSQTTGERHNTLEAPDLGGGKAAKPVDLTVTMNFTGSDGVTTSKKVSLLDVPPEELGKRLTNLSEEKLRTEIKATEDAMKVAEAEKRTADFEGLKAKLENLNELKTMRDSYELAKKGGKEAQFLAETQSRAKSGAGRGALGVLAKTGVVSALMLLFNDLVPEFNLGTGGPSDRVLPGSSG